MTWSSVDARGVEADADWKNLRSPETYLGYGAPKTSFTPAARSTASRLCAARAV